SAFSIERTADGVAVKFHDLMLDHQVTVHGTTTYSYQIKGERYESAKQTAANAEIRIDRAILAAAVEHGTTDTPVEVWIWTDRHTGTSEPVRVFFDWSPTRETFEVLRISRG